MGKPHEHAESSAKKFGGEAKDYLEIHKLIDSSRDAFGDVRHRMATHTSWFINVILPRIFGETIENSAHNDVSVRLIGEWHVLEDFEGEFIPTLQDFAEEIEMKAWMDNARGGAVPPSRKKIPSELNFPEYDLDDSSPCGPPGVLD
ncbi:MAG TPA: hypothetical protein VLG69_03750 [Candidatus Andersenbacteria bacterium]|nr:hypothetical protein [Candidatus Andersenbacteria bacterium]